MQIETIVQSGHYLEITNCVFSPDGQLIATSSNDESIKLWDIRMGAEIAVLRGHKGPVYRIAFNNDGKLLASCSWDTSVRIWNIEERKCVHVLNASQEGLQSVDKIAFNLSCTILAAAGTSTFGKNYIHLWDPHSAQKIHSFLIPENRISALTWSPDENLIAISKGDFEQASLRIMNATTGETILHFMHPIKRTKKELKGTNGIIPASTSMSLCFTANSQSLLFTCAGKAYMVGIKENATPSLVPINNDVFKIEPGLHDEIIAFGKNVTIWNTHTQKITSIINAVATCMSPNGELLAIAKDRNLQIIDSKSCTVIRELGSQMKLPENIGNMNRQFVIAANPVYPILASAAPDGLVRIWDLRKGGAPLILRAHENLISCICFHPSQQILATCGGSFIKIWKLPMGQLLHSIELKESAYSINFSADGTYLVSGDYNGTVSLIDISSGMIFNSYKVHKGVVDSIVGIDATMNLSVSGTTLCYWDHSFKTTKSFNSPHIVTILACSRNLVLSSVGGNMKWMGMGNPDISKGRATLLDLKTGEAKILDVPAAQLRCASFNPDGDILVCGSADGKVIAWDVNTAKEIFSIDAHAGDVTGICVVSDGSFIASIGLDTVIRLWETTTGKLAATLISLNDEDYISISDEGFYTATKAALRSVMFRSNGEIFPFDQFDLQLNRPDKFLQRLGYALPPLINAYAQAHERRLKHLHFSSNGNTTLNGKPPHVKFLSVLPIGVSPTRNIELTIGIESESAVLNRLLVFCNDVPVFGQDGVDIRPLGFKGAKMISFDLMTGDNKVQISAVDQNGIESSKAGFRTVFAGDQTSPKLYLLAIGVSKYSDSRYNLEYAAKDAYDLVNIFKELPNRFSQIITRTITDEAALRSAILQSRSFLEATSVDDHVVILFAGHGIIRNLDYYFLPTDVDIENIEASGISFAEIQSLLDGILARRRLVLLDTCHAGEQEEFEEVPVEMPLGDGVKGRTVREIAFSHDNKRERKQSRIPIMERLPELFADLRRDSGANVIAAAAAMEYAREFNKIGNGVFTSCVMEALRNAKTDKNADGHLTVSELYNFVTKKVIELTAGHQRPISRRENITDDFPVI